MDNKGITYTIEVVIAISILLTVVIFLFQTAPQTSLALEKQNAYNALSTLNGDGSLREAVVNEDLAATEALLDNYFDNYEFEICSDVCFGTAQQATIVEYYIAGFQDEYDPKKLRVFLFRD